MPWVSPATRSTGYLWTAANQNEIINDLLYLVPVAYVEFTSNVSVTATTVGTANQIVSAGAATYEAVPHLIEFYCPRWAPPAAVSNVILRDGSTVIGTLATFGASQSQTVSITHLRTPTAASHTYNVAAWVNSGTGTMSAGTGGVAGDGTTLLAGFIRITRVPT